MRWNLSVAGWPPVGVHRDPGRRGRPRRDGPVFYRRALSAITVGADRGRETEVDVAATGICVAGNRCLPGVVLAAHWSLFFLTIKLSSVAVAVVDGLHGAALHLGVAPLFLPERWGPVALIALIPAAAGWS